MRRLVFIGLKIWRSVKIILLGLIAGYWGKAVCYICAPKIGKRKQFRAEIEAKGIFAAELFLMQGVYIQDVDHIK